MSNKKYGLILPGAAKGQQPMFQASRNVFGDDSDSDEESKKPVLLRPSQNVNRQAKIEQEKALIEDPTVYQYDEVYDSMANKKEEKKVKSKEEMKPRYIENLMKSANKRKIENERRVERQIQKEREKEGDEFADKEVFVTSAYKKKLEELKLEEERERREEYLESIGDVTKQRDLGGFYRHLYEQKLGTDKKTEEIESQTIKDSDGDGSTTPDRPTTFKTLSKKSDSSQTIGNSESKTRNYRKRKMSSEVNRQLSEGEIVDSDDEINRVNLTDIRQGKRLKPIDENIDADSDFSVNDPSEDEGPSDAENKIQNSAIDKKNNPEKKSVAKDSAKKSDEDVKKESVKPKDERSLTPERQPPKPKIDIWKKRTVGEVFEQALKRYYERKASRGY